MTPNASTITAPCAAPPTAVAELQVCRVNSSVAQTSLFATVTKMQATEGENSPNDCGSPKAIGFVRGEVSGLDSPRHADAVQRHARLLGYQYAYTVRPPQGVPDPIGYALGIAAGLDVAAIVVYDLAQVDDQPARVCEEFDLETVCPATTWTRVASRAAEAGAA